MSKHTPGPWIAQANDEEGYYAITQDNVCLVGGIESESLAAHIVRACNSHDELIAALKKVALIATNLSAYGEVDQAIAHDLNVLILPAILKAEGGIK